MFLDKLTWLYTLVWDIFYLWALWTGLVLTLILCTGGIYILFAVTKKKSSIREVGDKLDNSLR